MAGTGLIRVVSPSELAQTEQDAALKEQQAIAPQFEMRIAAHIRSGFELARNHRASGRGWDERLMKSLRAFNGEYDPQKLQQIKAFAGAETYARLIGVKCRGATSLLRDLYLSKDRPWDVEPTPNPELPYNVYADIEELLTAEVSNLASNGQPIDEIQILQRMQQLKAAAMRAAKAKAADSAKIAADALDDILVEGGFYDAFGQFLVDLPMFPYGCLKGPVVRVVNDVHWENKVAVTTLKPRMFWERVSPFDLWWSPGAARIEDADVYERIKLSRSDLNAVMDLPGYNADAIRSVLEDYGRGGLRDWIVPSDSDQAIAESREDPNQNVSGLIDSLEFHGSVQGMLLLEYGLDDPSIIADPLRDYNVQAWLVGRHVIKVQINPSPRRRHPYFITSYEKMPGTIIGNALPDILEDVQDVANAAMRALVNNLAIASGPQVIINDDRIAPGHESNDQLYPWKRWHTQSDPTAGAQQSAQKAIDFYQPNSHAQELLGIFKEMSNLGDEISALPRYITGSERLGGAGRTASGLSLLMGNANKILQTVAANIDKDIIQPALLALFDMVMLTDKSGLLQGDENIVVKGVSLALQKEGERQRMIEFLTATGNPVDLQIMGIRGRANLLRDVANGLGTPNKIVPDDEEMAQKEKEQQQAAMAQQAMVAQQGGQPGGDPNAPPGAEDAPPANNAPKPSMLQGPHMNTQQPGH